MKTRSIITLFLFSAAIFLSSAFGCFADTGESENGYKSGDVKYLVIGAISSFVCVCAADLIARAVSKRKKSATSTENNKDVKESGKRN